ncbi:hypothetical protein [Oceaniglobus indicus]|uniref:hypothetical protein n=1 Tax=Oceaniglobus indicus TaxID=2047749 RepID=UPI001F4D9391|nr:hypothetical protein [Oceaniglobus indicus]
MLLKRITRLLGPVLFPVFGLPEVSQAGARPDSIALDLWHFTKGMRIFGNALAAEGAG